MTVQPRSRLGGLSWLTSPLTSAMTDVGAISRADAQRAMKEPIQLVARAVDTEAPYFVDYLGDMIETDYPGLTAQTGQVAELLAAEGAKLALVSRNSDELTAAERKLTATGAQVATFVCDIRDRQHYVYTSAEPAG